MRVRVELHGIIGKLVKGYDPDQGLDVEISRGARVGDLLLKLGLSVSKIGPVAVNGQLAKPASALPDNALVKVFQPVSGG